jgi:hypothetical protein
MRMYAVKDGKEEIQIKRKRFKLDVDDDDLW